MRHMLNVPFFRVWWVCAVMQCDTWKCVCDGRRLKYIHSTFIGFNREYGLERTIIWMPKWKKIWKLLTWSLGTRAFRSSKFISHKYWNLCATFCNRIEFRMRVNSKGSNRYVLQKYIMIIISVPQWRWWQKFAFGGAQVITIGDTINQCASHKWRNSAFVFMVVVAY